MDKRTKKELLEEIKSLKKIIERLKHDKKRDYEDLVSKYQAAERNLKLHPKQFGGKKQIKAYMDGILNGIVALDDNLKSTVMNG